MFFCEPTTNCEHKAQKILRTGGKSPSMFCECICRGGAAPSPPTPVQLFFFKAYLLCRDSPPPIETSPPPIETIEKKIIPKIKKKNKIFSHPFPFFSPSGAKAAAKGSIAETSTSTLNDRMHCEILWTRGASRDMSRAHGIPNYAWNTKRSVKNQ